MLSIGRGGSVFVYVLLCTTLCPFQFNNHLKEEKRAGCFYLFGLQMYCYCTFSVTLLHGAICWYAMRVIVVFPDNIIYFFLFDCCFCVIKLSLYSSQ